MRRLCKSIVALVVTLSLLAGLLCVGGITVSAGGVNDRLAQVRSIFPNKSYFTTTGKAATGDGAAECYYPSVVSNRLGYNWTNMYPSYSCCGFSHFVFRYIFGTEYTWSGAATTQETGVSTAQLNSLFASCVPGDVIYWNGSQHWSIFLGYTANSHVTVYDCNLYGESQVSWSHDFSYSYISSKASLVRRYHATNYDAINGSVTPSTPTTYESIAKGNYYIQNKESGNYLVVEQSVDANTQNIGVHPRTAESGMKIEIVEESIGHRLRPLCSNSRVVNAYGTTITSNHNVNLYDNTNETSQRWLFEKLSNGYYVIRNAQNPSCVLTRNGTNCTAITYTGADSQQWKLEPISPLVTPTISFDKSSYVTGDTITVSWPASPADSNLSHYWIVVADSAGNEFINQRVDKANPSFSFTVSTAGTYTVKVLATPVGSVSGEGSLTDTKTITVNVADASAPSITNIKVSDVDKTGYTITCTVTDPSGVSKVEFPTWTEANGQDDLLWKEGSMSGSTVTFRVDVADHNNEGGKYITHIYATDARGNKTVGHPVEVEIDRTLPSITKLSFYDVDETGYSIKVTFSDNVGVTRVACPSWTEANGQDDLLWKDAVIDGNTATFRVNVADHNHELGTYITDVYVYDASGNRVTSDWVWVYVTALSAPTKTVTWNGHIYAFYETYRSWTTAKELCEQLGGHLATVTSAEEQAFLQKHLDEKLYWIGATDEKEEGQWEWVTGEAWNYTAWAGNQPDNAAFGEHYVHLNSAGEWNDIHHEPNEYKIGFILEIDPAILPGDINLDGSVNLSDATNLFYYVNGLTTFNEDTMIVADINGDGDVNLNDATTLFYRINGLTM